MSASVLNYEALITSEHNQRPNFMKMIDVTTQGAVDAQNLCATFPAIFDIDLAVGQQLDMLGTWIGASRNLAQPLPPDGITVLPDGPYHTLLQAVIAANHWDGTVPGLYSIWGAVFGSEPYGEGGYGLGTYGTFTVLVQDNQDMTMFVVLVFSNFDETELALLTNGYFDLVPAGVQLLGYFQPVDTTKPVFGLDVDNGQIGGLDSGYLVEPITIG